MPEREISGLAVRSLLLEASLAPKPGLVTPYSNGSHRDMSFGTFVRSALALSNCFTGCAGVGRALSARPPGEARVFLKEIGIKGEKNMYRATGGVNTHKGAIYLLGFLCAAAGRLAGLRGNCTPRELARTGASFVQGVVERELALLASPSRLFTAGERAYMAYGLTGARGEVEEGYPLTLKALDFLQARLPRASLKNALTDTFFFIVSRNGDTNLYARGGRDGLETAWSLADGVLRAGGTGTREGWEKIRLTERVFVERNLSPGGSADILSCGVFLLSFAQGPDSLPWRLKAPSSATGGLLP
ncbi:MAG: triphosphoribosyl-dephospho-CoA synthase [Synergistaceae bacterium]|nr:triphosphoribosyl-dephospho-CoA synthase [Synergistaceae bacterium]